MQRIYVCVCVSVHKGGYFDTNYTMFLEEGSIERAIDACRTESKVFAHVCVCL